MTDCSTTCPDWWDVGCLINCNFPDISKEMAWALVGAGALLILALAVPSGGGAYYYPPPRY